MSQWYEWDMSCTLSSVLTCHLVMLICVCDFYDDDHHLYGDEENVICLYVSVLSLVIYFDDALDFCLDVCLGVVMDFSA